MMDAIILAGGMGTRLHSAVPDLPKPLADVRGRPFLCYLMDYWLAEGVSQFVLSVGYKHEKIESYFGSHYQGSKVNYAVEPEPLGTGGGLINAASKLRDKEVFLVLTGDTFFQVKLPGLLAAHQENSADMTLSLIKVKKNSRYSGIGLDGQGFVTGIEAREAVSSNWLANGGVYMMNRSLMGEYERQPLKKLSLEDEILPELIRDKKRLLGCISSGTFLDIGIPEDYERAADVLL